MRALEGGDLGAGVLGAGAWRKDGKLLITVWGVAPGVGTSTLCAGLAEWLTDAGLQTDFFREGEREADAFEAAGAVGLDTLLAASADFVDSMLESGDDVVVTDALMPFVPSLLALGHGDEALEEFMTELDDVLAPVEPVLVYLDGDVDAALARVVEREGPEWMDSYVDKLARYGVTPKVTDAGSAVEYLRRERAVTLGVARRPGWRLVRVERAGERSPAQVLRAVTDELPL